MLDLIALSSMAKINDEACTNHAHPIDGDRISNEKLDRGRDEAETSNTGED